MARVLALDVGTKTIGVAKSDPLGMFAQPVETIARKSVVKDTQRIATLVAELGAVGVVVGLPYELDGSEQRSAKLARQVGESVAEVTGMPVHYVDERYSSVEAERRLIEQGVSRKRRKEIIDQAAAVVILEAYLAESGS
jgi:putative Holliday junction resolvase